MVWVQTLNLSQTVSTEETEATPTSEDGGWEAEMIHEMRTALFTVRCYTRGSYCVTDRKSKILTDLMSNSEYEAMGPFPCIP